MGSQRTRRWSPPSLTVALAIAEAGAEIALTLLPIGVVGFATEVAAAATRPALDGANTSASSTEPHALRVAVVSDAGDTLAARVTVRGSDFVYYPSAADTATIAHHRYSYPRPDTPIFVPTGPTFVSANRGPEWTPVTDTIWVDQDTLVTLTLSRFLDLRPRGLYSGDLHTHSKHPPIEFGISPGQAMRIARAEQLSVLEVLDQDNGFTAGPHPLSDSLNVLDYSYEFRNQTYGHAELPGLVAPIDDVCCLDPDPAWPMLMDLRSPAVCDTGALLILSHPRTTAAFGVDTSWPGAGLGRELPVDAALGVLDGLDVMSYSNVPGAWFTDWYDLLSSGLTITPTAGTDAVLDWFNHHPAGGWRVYADVGAGKPLDYRAWLAAIRAGRTFVTNLPLILDYTVAGACGGAAIEAPDTTLSVQVHLGVACVTGLSRATLVCERGEIWSATLSRRNPVPVSWDTTFTLATTTPGWLALKVEGIGGDPMLLDMAPIAHSNAVRVTRLTAPRRDGGACGRMLDRLDQLQNYLIGRGGWASTAEYDSVLARIGRARVVYARAFAQPPVPGTIQAVNPQQPLDRLEWTAAEDPDPGDHVRYRVIHATDAAFAAAETLYTDSTFVDHATVVQQGPRWWRVEAFDRFGNVVVEAPDSVETLWGEAAQAGVGADAPRPPRVWPNPARGAVHIDGFADDVVVHDVTGRRIASLGRGLVREGRGFVWSRGGDARARPGRYWVVSRRSGARKAVVLIE